MDDTINQFRKQSLLQLQNLEPSDIQPYTSDNIQENITIVARLDDSSKEKIQTIMEKLKEKDPDQYYYSQEQLHITLLGGVDTKTSYQVIEKALNQTFPKYNLSFKLWGVSSNALASSVSAYPQFNLHRFREDLRQHTGSRGDDYTVHLQMYENMGWINYMRYLKTPNQRLLDELLSFKDKEFGYMKTIKVEAYKNTSKVLDLKKAELIYSKDL